MDCYPINEQVPQFKDYIEVVNYDYNKNHKKIVSVWRLKNVITKKITGINDRKFDHTWHDEGDYPILITRAPSYFLTLQRLLHEEGYNKGKIMYCNNKYTLEVRTTEGYTYLSFK